MPTRALTPLLLLATATSLCAQQDPAARPPFDPLRGMDPDGRIEKPQIPQDVPHPERWRYTPPKRASSRARCFERFLVSSFITPILFREKDIGFGGGIALTDVDFRDNRYREFANILLTYSEEGQQAYRINWSRWLNYRELPTAAACCAKNAAALFGRLGYEKTLTRRFFGLGSRTRGRQETSYTEELTGVGLGIRLSLPDPAATGWCATTCTTNHGLSRGRVSDLPSTDQVVPRTVRRRRRHVTSCGR
jgi:hypothetical protein